MIECVPAQFVFLIGDSEVEDGAFDGRLAEFLVNLRKFAETSRNLVSNISEIIRIQFAYRIAYFVEDPWDGGNDDWLEGLHVVEQLRDVAAEVTHFSGKK